MRALATARWTAEDGPLSDAPGAIEASSRFVRLAAHVIGAIDMDRRADTAWVVGTGHGPRHAAMQAAAGGPPPPSPFTIPDAVSELVRRLDHLGPISIVAAGRRTVAMALVDAATRVAGGDVIVVWAEEGTPVGDRSPVHDAVAVAVRLASSGSGPRLGVPQRRADLGATIGRTIPPAVTACELAPALALVDALRHGVTGWHPLEPDTGPRDAGWAVEISL